MTKRKIIVCFDNNQWIQETVEIEDSNDNFRFIKFKEDYISEYEKVKASIPIMKAVTPTIIHIAFID